MHQPRPYGLHVIGLPLTDKDESFISSVAARITNLKELSGIDSMKMVYDLPDGGYVIVQDMGGNFRVIAHKPIPKDSMVFDGLATDYIPMLFSGVVTNSVLYPEQGLGLRITEQTALRLNNYDKKTKPPDKDLELKRFRIDYADKHQVFKPRKPTGTLRTQYNKLRPTWYSGAMAEVMQIVGGYGRQNFLLLPDDPIERATIKLPPSVSKDIKDQLGNIRLPAYTGLPDVDGQFLYSYSFSGTNGVGFDTDNKPWLLQIGATGVWAMPLPVIPATSTKAFRDYIKEVKDTEILAILDRFGAMPSGETFPVGDDWQAWLRAGAIIEVCGTSDFYINIAYSSACGWSLNSNGNEGYNTCYNYKDDAGIGYGLTYKLRLMLAPAENHLGEEAYDINGMLPERADRVRQYLNGLIPTLDIGTAKASAILYKLRRVEPYVIHSRALVHNGSNDVDYWDNLELTPIANHSGNVTKVYEGYLYHPSPFDVQPQIKFPEPLLDGCVSHDFLPINRQLAQSEYPNSDTIMFTYYIGNSLKTVKYFIDWSSFKQETVSDFERYMYAGEWEQEEYNGSSSIQGYFYSSDIDDREVVAPTIINTKVVGKDLGFDSRPYYEFDGIGTMCGSITRLRYYTTDTTVNTSGDRVLSLGICVPYLCRNGLINAKHDFTSTRTVAKSFVLNWVQDPHMYRFWTYDPVFANFNMTIENPEGTPQPVDGDYVWVEERSYSPSSQNDWADNGDFINGMPANYTWLVHPGKNEWDYGGGGTMPKVTNTESSTNLTQKEVGNLSFSMSMVSGEVNKYIPNNWYFVGSPTINSNVFYTDACAVVFGETEYCNLSEPNEKSARATWGYSKLTDNDSAHHFIGVINE